MKLLDVSLNLKTQFSQLKITLQNFATCRVQCIGHRNFLSMLQIILSKFRFPLVSPLDHQKWAPGQRDTCPDCLGFSELSILIKKIMTHNTVAKTLISPPLNPAPSAKICSSSCVAPPVMRDRMRVRAFGLKYV